MAKYNCGKCGTRHEPGNCPMEGGGPSRRRRDPSGPEQPGRKKHVCNMVWIARRGGFLGRPWDVYKCKDIPDACGREEERNV